LKLSYTKVHTTIQPITSTNFEEDINAVDILELSYLHKNHREAESSPTI
jgi:hypothetical protein